MAIGHRRLLPAIEAGPESADLYVARGLLHLQSGEEAAAVGDINEAIALEPDNARLYLTKGDIYHHSQMEAEGWRFTGSELTTYEEQGLIFDGEEMTFSRGDSMALAAIVRYESLALSIVVLIEL